MERIYILSAQGGAYSNFFGLLIGSDANYGSLPFDYNEHQTSTNMFVCRHLEFQRYIKDNSTGKVFPQLTEFFKKRLYRYTEDRNIILHTHYYQSGHIDLKNLKKVRFYSNDDHVLLIYLMFLAKVSTRKVHLTNQVINNLSIDYPHINEVLPDQEVSNLSLDAFLEKTSIEEYVLEIQKSICSSSLLLDNNKFDDWDYLDVHNLLFNPEKYVKLWKEYFDLKNEMNIDILKKFLNQNIAVVNTMFGIKYDYDNGVIDNWQESVLKFSKEYDTPIKLKD